MTEPGTSAHDEGIRKLESMLAGTRMHATRALRELHERMQADLAEAQQRAARAERKLEKSRQRTKQVRASLDKARKRARKAERRLRQATAGGTPVAAAGPVPPTARPFARAVRLVRRAGRRKV
jgi:hypothetical protein